MTTNSIDAANAEFWNELCGTGLAKHLGITDHSLVSLKRFDDYYLWLYPYLLRHVPVDSMRGKRVLEIGLGYGTLGQKIAEAGADYIGLDIAEGPVMMMNHRLRLQGMPGGARQGNMLQCPLPNESVDAVVSIGCFHHTGDTQRCLDETWRVLRPGGNAYVMVYNQLSYRQWLNWPWATFRAWGSDRGWAAAGAVTATQRGAYDANASGASAPETAFATVRQLRGMLSRFRSAEMVLENCDDLAFGGLVLVSRKKLLSTIGKWFGLDIYLVATK